MNDTPTMVLVVVVGVLVATGVVLLLERSLTRILLGVILMGNGVNLMLLSTGGAAGGQPLLGFTPENEMSDPLPQAMILTAIVITLGVTAFLLAMAHRSWQLQGNDEVQDDAEDRRIVLGGGRVELRHRIRAQKRDLRNQIEEQRAQMQRRMDAEDQREAAERDEIRSEIAQAKADLRACVSDEERYGTEQATRYMLDRKRNVRDQVTAYQARVDEARDSLKEHVRADREAERELHRELRQSIRRQKRELRRAVRAERERLARAEDSDMQGAD